MDDYYQERSKKLLKEIEALLAKFDVSTLDTPQNDPMEQCDQCIHADVCALKISRLHGLDVSQCEHFKPARQWISVKDGMPEDFIDHSKDVRQIKVLVAIKAKTDGL